MELPSAGHTCAKEEHLVAPIHRIHKIHSQGGEAVGDIGPHQEGTALEGIDCMEHQGMGPHEGYQLIRKLTCGAKAWGEGSSRALKKGKTIP